MGTVLLVCCPAGEVTVTMAVPGVPVLSYAPVMVAFVPVRAYTVGALSRGRAVVTGWPPATRPPPLVVTHSPLSVAATQKLTVAQDTWPASLLVSEVTAVQDEPPSPVPSRACSAPTPAAQQCCTSGQLIESSPPEVSSVRTPCQVTPPSVEVISAAPLAAAVSPAAWQVGRAPETGRQLTLSS